MKVLMATYGVKFDLSPKIFNGLAYNHFIKLILAVKCTLLKIKSESNSA